MMHRQFNRKKSNLTTPKGAELRVNARKRMIKAGVISYNDHHFTVPCAVRNISDLGARLKVGDRALVPDTFILMIELDALEVDCEIVWRSRNEVGVKFVSDIRTTKKLRVQVVSSSRKSEKKNVRQDIIS